MNAPLSLALPAQATSAARARQFVTEALNRWALSDYLVEVLLVVSELVENAVNHAGVGCEVRLHRDLAGLMVTVIDQSPELPRIPHQRDVLSVGGRGLLMVQAIADSWGVTPTGDGKAVWVRLVIRT